MYIFIYFTLNIIASENVVPKNSIPKIIGRGFSYLKGMCCY